MDPASCMGPAIVRQHQIPDNGREELSNETYYLTFVLETVAVAIYHSYPAKTDANAIRVGGL